MGGACFLRETRGNQNQTIRNPLPYLEGCNHSFDFQVGLLFVPLLSGLYCYFSFQSQVRVGLGNKSTR